MKSELLFPPIRPTQAEIDQFYTTYVASYAIPATCASCGQLSQARQTSFTYRPNPAGQMLQYPPFSETVTGSPPTSCPSCSCSS